MIRPYIGSRGRLGHMEMRGCRGRPLCLPKSRRAYRFAKKRATTEGCPYGVFRDSSNLRNRRNLRMDRFSGSETQARGPLSWLSRRPSSASTAVTRSFNSCRVMTPLEASSRTRAAR